MNPQTGEHGRNPGKFGGEATIYSLSTIFIREFLPAEPLYPLTMIKPQGLQHPFGVADVLCQFTRQHRAFLDNRQMPGGFQQNRPHTV